VLSSHSCWRLLPRLRLGFLLVLFAVSEMVLLQQPVIPRPTLTVILLSSGARHARQSAASGTRRDRLLRGKRLGATGRCSPAFPSPGLATTGRDGTRSGPGEQRPLPTRMVTVCQRRTGSRRCCQPRASAHLMLGGGGVVGVCFLGLGFLVRFQIFEVMLIKEIVNLQKQNTKNPTVVLIKK